MAAKKTRLTADDLIRLPDDGYRHELIDGVLTTMPPAGGEHGIASVEVGRLVGNHVRAHDLGWVFGAETGFLIGGDVHFVRAPDVAFVAAGRFPDGRPPAAFPNLVPNLVVEVVSPWDTTAEVEAKAQMWLRAGARLVWVAWPPTRSVTVYRSPAEVRVLGEDDDIDGGDVLPGFTCPVREFFPF